MLTFEPSRLVGCWERYICGRTLGEGAFGSVHQALCLQSGTQVAVKSVRLVGQAHADVSREAAMLMSVRHAHVVRLLNYFETAQSAQLVRPSPDACPQHPTSPLAIPCDGTSVSPQRAPALLPHGAMRGEASLALTLSSEVRGRGA